MKKRLNKNSIILLIILISGFYSGKAQSEWSLQQCIDYAMEHNINIRQSRLSEQQAQNNYENSRRTWIPTVNAGVGENFYLGRSMSAENTYVSKNSSNTSINISLSMPVFSGLSIYRETQAAKYNLRAVMQDLKSAQMQINLNIISSYMEILFNKETLKIAEKQLEEANKQHKKIQIMFESGKISESEVYESAAQISGYNNSVIEANNSLTLSLLSMAQLLQLPDVSQFDIIAPEQFNILDSISITDLAQITHYALENHPKMQAERYRLQQSEYQLKNAYTRFIPSVSLSAGYGTGYYYYFHNINNINFNRQLQQNGSAMIGFQLNIPIWDISHYYNIKNSEIEIEMRKCNIENTQNELTKEIQTAYYNAVAARQKYLSEQKNLAASQLAYTYTEAKFNSGKSTAYELNESRLRYYKSESSLLQAKYQYLFCQKILDFYGSNQ